MESGGKLFSGGQAEAEAAVSQWSGRGGAGERK